MTLLGRKRVLGLLLAVLAVIALTASACGGEEESPPTPTAAQPTVGAPGGKIAFTAASATITVDGDTSDGSGIPAVTVPMEQIRMDEIDPRADIKFDPVAPIDVKLRVATDGQSIYLLMEVPDDHDFNPGDHHLSPAIAVMFPIDKAAGVHMGHRRETWRRAWAWWTSGTGSWTVAPVR